MSSNNNTFGERSAAREQVFREQYQAISFRLQPDYNGGKTNMIRNLISFLVG